MPTAASASATCRSGRPASATSKSPTSGACRKKRTSRFSDTATASMKSSPTRSSAIASARSRPCGPATPTTRNIRPGISRSWSTAPANRRRSTTSLQLGRAKLSARIRLEQRWREGVGRNRLASAALSQGTRFRSHGKTAAQPQQRAVRRPEHDRFPAASGLDRVRNLISFSTPLTKRLTGEAGYMNQHGFVRGGEDSSDNIAYFALGLSL